MDLRRQLGVLRTWTWLLIASLLLAGGAAYLVSSALPKVYEAKVTLLVGQSLQSTSPDYNQLLASQRLSQTYADLATTSPVLQSVIDQVQLGTTVGVFRGLVKADAPHDSTLITITAQDGDPARAARVANAIADQLRAQGPAISGRETSVQQFVDTDLKATQQQIADTQLEVQRLSGLINRTPDEDAQLNTLQARVISLRQTYATLFAYSSSNGTNLLTVVDPASPPSEPAAPRVLLNTILAALLGLLIAIGVAFMFEYLDDTLKDADDVAETTGLALLGGVLRMKGDEGRQGIYRLAALLYPRSPAAEAYRTLRTNVEFASVDGPIRSILVTSSRSGEGKTTTAANLAAVFAQAGKRTVLLDADLRKPGIHRIFDLNNQVGLTSMLRSENLSLTQVAQATDEDNLRVITTGPLPPNPVELLASHRMATIMEKLKAVADVVIVDSPPLQAVTDAAILSTLTDGTVFVIDAGRTRRTIIRNGFSTLSKGGAHVLGAVLNRLSPRTSGDYYYYDDDYYRGSSSEPADGSTGGKGGGSGTGAKDSKASKRSVIAASEAISSPGPQAPANNV